MERESKDEALPPGFRFHPTDEELVSYYLAQKLTDSTFSGRAIADVDLNKCEPWDLPGKARMGEKEWYFFSVRDRKYPTGLRTNRATTAGYWKTTGKDKEICGGAAEVVGMKKTLVFYRGRAPRGEKTNWVMHEYRLVARSPYKNFKEEWVLCRVFQKSQGAKKPPVGQLRSNSHAHDWVAPSRVQLSPFHRQLGCTGRGYAELAELTRTALRGIHGIGSIMQPLLGGLTAANLAPGSPTWHPDAYAAQSLNVGVDSSPSCILQAEPPFQQAEAYADGGLWPSF